MPKNPPHVSGRDAVPGRLRGVTLEVAGTLLAEGRPDTRSGIPAGAGAGVGARDGSGGGSAGGAKGVLGAEVRPGAGPVAEVRARPGAGPRWLALDLRAVCEVRSVEVEFGPAARGHAARAGGPVPDVRVEVSLDGLRWRTAREAVRAAGGGAPDLAGDGPDGAPVGVGATALLLDEPAAARWVRVAPVAVGGPCPAAVRVHGTCAHERPAAVLWTAWPTAGAGPEAEWDLVLDDLAGVAEGAELSAPSDPAARAAAHLGPGARTRPGTRVVTGMATGVARVPATGPGTEMEARLEPGRLPDPAAGTDGLGALGGLDRLGGLDDVDRVGGFGGPDAPGAPARHAWWYVRRFALPAGAANGLRLEVEGVGHEAEFWLDGQRIGTLPHPFPRAGFDVADFAGAGESAAAGIDEGGTSGSASGGADAVGRAAGSTAGPEAAEGLRLRTLAVRLTPEPHLSGPRAQGPAAVLRCPDAPARPAGPASARTVAAALAPRVRLCARPPVIRAAANTATAYRDPGTLADLDLGVRGWWPGEWEAPQACQGAGLPEAFVRAVEERLGAATSAAAFLRRARIVDYENLRAAVEAAAARPWRHAAVPEDVAGWTDAGRCGVRAARARLHVQADPHDGSVLVVNRGSGRLQGAVVTARLYDLGGRPLAAPVTAPADVPASGTAHVLTVPFQRSLPAAHLLRLTLAGADGAVLSANDYWRHRTPTDLRALGGLPFAGLSLRTRTSGQAAATAVVTNTGTSPAAWVRVALRGHDTVLDAWHVPCLLPGESREVVPASRAEPASSGTDAFQIVAEAYNALPVHAG